MSSIRSNPPKELGLEVESIKDYLAGVPGFTKSNVLFYNLSDGCAVAIRPSGTEPKVKSYVMAQGSTRTEAEANKAAIRSAVDKILKA